MKRLTVLSLIVTLAAQVQAGVPEPISAWEFNAPDPLRATTGAPLQLVGAIKSVPGINAVDGAVQKSEGTYFICTHGIAPNGGGTKVNEWTLLIDFSFPPSSLSDPPSGYNDLFQTNPTNVDDADWTINSSGAIGIGAVGYSSTKSYTTKGNTWYRMVVVVDNGTRHDLYMDGVEVFKGTQQGVDGRFSLASTILLFCAGNNQDRDDATMNVSAVAFWNTPLSAGDIATLGKAGDKFFTQKRASGPAPADGATDVPRDAMLNWMAAEYPCTHDVYFGAAPAEVDSATRTDAKGVLVSQGQADTTFDPAGSFAYGQTYYWRIDEVNTSPDGTVSKGTVWSFTAEPYGYPITKVTATASSAQAGSGPEKTVDGSGMDKGDKHGTDGMTMWLSTGATPNWIQYEFDKVYKLYDLKVWNSNQLIEAYLGFGAKDVKIEYSTDGTTWTLLAGVPQFAKAPAAPGYSANTTVSFGGVPAKYVRLTINGTWGGMSTVAGLSEVRFSYAPVQARSPQPATGATGLAVDTTLSWRPGREAGSHQVFFGTDQAAVTDGTVPAQAVADHAFGPGALTYGTAYYWKVDEVNTVTYPGDVWSFTTQEFAVVDDFESYNDTTDCIFDTWIDGLADGKSGSVVGYDKAPFAERTIIHGGKQSMPLAYDNSKTPFYSETTRDLGTPQDWTGNGATDIAVWFRGYPALGPVPVAETDGKMILTGAGTDIWNTSDDFVFAYKTLNGDGAIIARVVSVGTGSNTWAKGGVMIRDGLNGGSTFADMVLTGSAGNGASFQYRPVANAACGTGADAPAVLKPPYWVKIQRTGNNLAGYVSANGTTWTQQGATQTIAMTAPVYLGLCVTSHAAGQQRTFEFDNISTTGGVTGAWQGVQINSPQYNDPADLYVVVEDSSGKSKLMAHPNPAAAATGAWTQWKIPFSDLTAAGVKTSKVKKVTLGVGDRSNPKAGGTGMLYLDDLGFGHPAK